MHEEAIYRCVNPACARLMPRPVMFCPWCGTAQAGAQASAQAAPAAQARAPAEAPAAASASSWSDAPPPSSAAPGTERGGASADAGGGRETDKRAAHEAAGTAAARAGLAGARADAGSRTGADARASAGTDAPAPPPVRPARSGWLGTAFGHGGGSPAQPEADSVPRPEIPARPAEPRRAPIRLRYWVLVLLLLWGVWLVAGPNSSRKIEERIAHASTLANACKAKEAQDELIALRKTRATPEQLEQLQAALNEGAAACVRKRQKERAWNEASAAAESALAAGNPERASARLQVYTRRYGDDARARALRQRIEDALHPLAAPSDSP